MSNRLLKTLTLLAFATCSTLALADDPPARVGRVALAQGQVTIAGDDEPPSAALVNWPVTSNHTITTTSGARTELRVGSTSVRLDGDSALEVLELDDEHLRLHLHYGSASVTVVNPELLAGFELTTPEARVRLSAPGRLRVDAGRAADTTTVSVFDGVAFVGGAGQELSLRAGRSAEVSGDDVRTAQAVRSAFDDWSYARDRYEEQARSARYVTTEMTGYEDLDRYGSWRNDAEYGALWIPAVSSSWVPYRDGSWVWVDPWGWTWVDNAPWGYAPFHYGRWVYLHQRWCWAPGRHDRHPVWSPALVGWVGGAGWSVRFNGHGGHRPLPAQGWYPLSPHERFVPTWHASEQHLRWWNRGVRNDGRRDHDHDHDHDHRQGLTVVPHDAFGQHGRVVVPKVPHAALPALALQRAPAAAPPRPRDWHRGDGRGRADHERTERGGRPPVAMAPPVLGTRPAAMPDTPPRQHAHANNAVPPMLAAPAPAPAPVLRAPERQAQGWQRGERDGRHQFDEARRQQFDEARRQREQAAHANGTVPVMRPLAPPQVQDRPNPGESGFMRHGPPTRRGEEGRERYQRERERVSMPAPVLQARPPVQEPARPLAPPARPLAPPPRPAMPPPEVAARPAPMPAEQRAAMVPQMLRPLPRPAPAMLAPPATHHNPGAGERAHGDARRGGEKER